MEVHHGIAVCSFILAELTLELVDNPGERVVGAALYLLQELLARHLLLHLGQPLVVGADHNSNYINNIRKLAKEIDWLKDNKRMLI